jgi:hypothetical protein
MMWVALGAMLAACSIVAAGCVAAPGGSADVVPEPPGAVGSGLGATPAPADATEIVAAVERKLRTATGGECIGGTEYLMSRSAGTYRQLMADEGVESGWNAVRSIWLGPIEALDNDPSTDLVGATATEAWVLLERDGRVIAGRFVPLVDDASGRTYWVQDAVRVPIPCG